MNCGDTGTFTGDEWWQGTGSGPSTWDVIGFEGTPEEMIGWLGFSPLDDADDPEGDMAKAASYLRPYDVTEEESLGETYQAGITDLSRGATSSWADFTTESANRLVTGGLVGDDSYTKSRARTSLSKQMGSKITGKASTLTSDISEVRTDYVEGLYGQLSAMDWLQFTGGDYDNMEED